MPVQPERRSLATTAARRARGPSYGEGEPGRRSAWRAGSRQRLASSPRGADATPLATSAASESMMIMGEIRSSLLGYSGWRNSPQDALHLGEQARGELGGAV